jgi:hypothetical protein
MFTNSPSLSLLVEVFKESTDQLGVFSGEPALHLPQR